MLSSYVRELSSFTAALLRWQTNN